MLLQNMIILTHLSVVDGIEECHAANQQLEEWSNAHLLGLHILVLPPPPGWNHKLWWYYFLLDFHFTL